MRTDKALNLFNSDKNLPKKKIVSISLFGSRARGDARKDSDYDLLVLVRPNFSRKDTDRLYHAVMNVLISTGNVLSLKIFTMREYTRLLRMKTPFIQNISREAVAIG